MVDYISAKNYKILSDKELIEWQNETKNKIKELQNRLLNINRAIKNRKIGNYRYEKYQKNINNLEWRINYGFEHIPYKHLERF